ncbi:MAG: glucose-6-phosphate isomerase [Firmicutes bacterium]|nr:glucose-6-phosphate isomerase [Bacillota bacterium]
MVSEEKVTLDYSPALGFINRDELANLAPRVRRVHQVLHDRSGPGREYLGWLEWPLLYERDEFARIKEAAERIQKQSEVLVVVGIGGSYLGARAGLEMLLSATAGEVPNGEGVRLLFAGHQLSPAYLDGLLNYLRGNVFSLNGVSISGTTTEPAVAFRFLRRLAEEKYGRSGAAERIYVTTDREKGALRRIAEDEGYERFVIPADVGGRYSVLTPVGLLPFAAAGIDIEAVMAGAAAAYQACSSPELEVNECYQYAALRQIFYNRGKTVELLVSYEPALHYLAEWWKQLFGESEGKDGKGLFPAACDFTTDLHSLGQYIQEGRRLFFETVLRVEDPGVSLAIPRMEDDLDGLNYLAGRSLGFLNEQVLRGTVLAHVDGGIPNLILNIPALTPYYFGYLVYFLQKACAASAYLLGVNPFNQPGVEAYKQNVFALLGKAGYEEQGAALRKRLEKMTEVAEE